MGKYADEKKEITNTNQIVLQQLQTDSIGMMKVIMGSFAQYMHYFYYHTIKSPEQTDEMEIHTNIQTYINMSPPTPNIFFSLINDRSREIYRTRGKFNVEHLLFMDVSANSSNSSDMTYV